MFWHMEANTDTSRRLAYPIHESAHLLGISPRGVYRLIESGDLRTVTLGRRRLVPADELARITRPAEAAA